MQIKDAISRAKKDIGVSSDDTFIGSRYVYSHIKSIRAVLLQQQIEKKGVWSSIPMQVLKKFPLKLIDIAESPEFTAGEYYFKSEKPFPELLDTKEGKITGGVFLPTGERVDLTTFSLARNSKNRRFKSETSKCFLRDGHFYITNYPVITEELLVDIEGIYESPEEVERLNGEGCINECIYYPDLPFYLPGFLEDRLFQIVKEKLAFTLNIPLDNQNNAKQDLQTKTPQNVQNPD